MHSKRVGSYVKQGAEGALVTSNGGRVFAGVDAGEEPVDEAGEVALERAQALLRALAVGEVASEVLARGRVDAGLGERDHVQGAVELAVAGAVEPVALLASRGGVQRGDAGVAGQLGVGGATTIRRAAVITPQPGIASSIA